MEANTFVLEKPSNYEVTPDYDGLWKALIEELFEEFMQFFAADLCKEIDFSKGTNFLNKEFLKNVIIKKKGRVTADQIVEVHLKSGQEKWILVHIEVQGKAGKDFAERMFRYFYRIYDKHNKEIYAIALLTDEGQPDDANHFHYEFYGTKVDYKYNVYSFDDQNLEKLEESTNPFAAAVIAGIYADQTKQDVNKRYAFKRKLMIQLLQMPTQQEDARTYIAALFDFIDNILQVPSELQKQLTDDIIPYARKEAVQQMNVEKNKSETWAGIIEALKIDVKEAVKEEVKEAVKEEVKEAVKEEAKEEAKKEAKEEGKKEATIDLAKELVRKDFSNEQIMELTKLELDEVVKLRRSLLT